MFSAYSILEVLPCVIIAVVSEAKQLNHVGVPDDKIMSSLSSFSAGSVPIAQARNASLIK